MNKQNFRAEPWHQDNCKQRIIFQEDVTILRDFYIGDDFIITYDNRKRKIVITSSLEEKLVFILETIQNQGLEVNMDFLTGWLIGCLYIPEDNDKGVRNE